MTSVGYPSLDAPAGVNAVTLLRKALGRYFDIRVEKETVKVGDRDVKEDVVRIIDRSTQEVRLSLWLSR